MAIPAEGLIKIQILQSGISLISGGHVDKGQTDAGHDLEHETKQRAATENIKPAPCAGGHRVACGRFEELADMQPIVNPKGNFSQHTSILFLPNSVEGRNASCRLLKKTSCASHMADSLWHIEEHRNHTL
jgi:hypothetical protein